MDVLGEGLGVGRWGVRLGVEEAVAVVLGKAVLDAEVFKTKILSRTLRKTRP
jgi:hypothetical protein